MGVRVDRRRKVRIFSVWLTGGVLGSYGYANHELPALTGASGVTCGCGGATTQRMFIKPKQAAIIVTCSSRGSALAAGCAGLVGIYAVCTNA
ncbi:rhomboid family intramembrane serine protease [Stutzerimonas stutzeri]|uniref:rhomboid family intramembrane serine protease n=1 Tax=Stutzerimonas stutzeri TaxID=316 RepID=UPI00101AD5C6